VTRKTTPHPVQDQRWLTPTLWGFGLASLFSDMGHEMATALMPGFLTALGAPPIALGLVEGVSNVGMHAAKVAVGRRLDRLSDRRPLLVLGYLATGIKALFALASNWPTVLVLRTLGWIGRGARGPARDAVIADTVPRSAYGKAYGFRESMDTVGAVAGPVAATLLLPVLGYRTLFWWTLVPSLLSVLCIAALVREAPERAERIHRAGPVAAAVALPRSFQRFLVPVGVFAVGNMAPTFLILRASQLLSGPHGPVPAQATAMALYVVHNVCYALGAFPSGRLADLRGARRPLAGGYALWFLAMVGFAIGPHSAWALLPLFVLSGASVAAVEALQTTVAASLLPPDCRGTGLGLQSALAGVGTMVSGVLTGGLWSLFGARVAFAVSAALSLAGSCMLLDLRVDEGRPSDVRHR
jgi:MFS family permease